MTSIPGGGSPAPESPRPDDTTATRAVASRPEESQPSRPTPGSAAVASEHHHDRRRNRPLWKKILTPIVLAVIGGILFLAAIALYSSPGELPSPPYSTLEIVSTFSINSIYYDVSQVSPSTAKIYVQLALRGGVQHPPAKAAAPSFYLLLSSGIHFKTCPARLLSPSYQQCVSMEHLHEISSGSYWT